MLSRLLCLCAVASLAASVTAADTVWVEATIPSASEEGLVPGMVTFKRNGTSSPLTINYVLGGNARSDKQRGYVSEANFFTGNDHGDHYYRRAGVGPAFPATAAGVDASTTRRAYFRGDGIGGQIVSFTVTGAGGRGYPASPLPTVTVTDLEGRGAIGLPHMLGRISSIAMTAGGAGYPATASATLSGGSQVDGAETPIITTTVGAGGSLTIGISNPNGLHGYLTPPTLTIIGTGTTPAAATLNVTYYVTSIEVVDSGSGYINPSVSISPPPSASGTTATATALVRGNALQSLTVLDPGSNYHIPAVAVVGGTGAVVRSVQYRGAVCSLAVEKGGSGFPQLQYFDPSGNGSGASALMKFDENGSLVEVVPISIGSGYSPATTLGLTGGGSAAVGVLSFDGQGGIEGYSITNGGSNYVRVTLDGSPVSPGVEYSVYEGELIDVSMSSAFPVAEVLATQAVTESSGYLPGDSTPLQNAGTARSATASFVVADSDYEAPAGMVLDSGSGEMTGTLTFPVGVSAVTRMITPRRNGTGGGRSVEARVGAPSLPGQYITDTSQRATVTINDADDSLSLAVLRDTAYPVPALNSTGLPLEVQGRAEWRLSLASKNSYSRMRRIQLNFGADSAIGPGAIDGVDYILASGDKKIDLEGPLGASTADDFAVVNSGSDPVAAVGSTVIKVNSTGVITAGNVVCFEYPSIVTNGIYMVTAVDGPARTITISPGIRSIVTVNNQTRIRKLGDRVTANPYERFFEGSEMYFFAFPLRSAAPRGRRSVKISVTATNDYQIRTPTSGSVTIADDAVEVGLRWSANAGRPNTNGAFQVVLSKAFPVDINVPFVIDPNGTTAVLYNGTNPDGDFTIANVDGSTPPPYQGLVRVSAGTMSKTVELVPRTSTPTSSSPETVHLALTRSPDYLVAPTGSSGVDPDVSLTIAPLQATDLGEDVYLAVAKRQDGAEGSPVTNGIFRVYVADTDGNARTGTLTQGMAFSYTVSGSAAANVDYQALVGTGFIPSGANYVDVAINVNDDLMVEGDEDVRVQINAGAGYQVSSLSSASVTIVDDEPVMSVSAVTDAYEQGVSGSFTITASQAVNRAVTVRYNVGGTTTPGSDFGASDLPGTVVMPPNQTQVVLTVVPKKDLAYDPEETVVLTLLDDSISPATYGVSSTDKSKTMTIHDVPVVKIEKTADAVEGVTEGVFLLSNACDQPATASITVRLQLDTTVTPLATQDSNAEAADGDYSTTPIATGSPPVALVTIPAGQRSVSIPVTAHFDGISEPSEKVTFFILPDTTGLVDYVTSSDPAHSTPSTATVTITDPVTPVISIALSSDATEGTATGAFTVTNEAATAWPAALTISYTMSGTADASDYTGLSGTVVLPKGATSVSIPVVAVADRIIESPETVTVQLSTSATYNLGPNTQATMTITDSDRPLIAIRTLDSVSEGSSTKAIVVMNTRSTPHVAAIRVDYTIDATVAHAATDGVDYVSLSGTLNIPANQSSEYITIAALADVPWDEGTEIIKIDLVSYDSSWGGVPYTVVSPSSAQVSIVDTSQNPDQIPPDPPVVTPVAPASDNGGGCGVGSGLGVALAGLGMVLAAGLRRRRRDAA